MAAIDPTKYRLSDTILLSDAIGCDSSYRHGYPNPVHDYDEYKLGEGANTADWLDQVQDSMGPCSITYGLIHSTLSRRIVKYQDPDKPSYHRWDDGAAMDVCFHDSFVTSEGGLLTSPENAPIIQAYRIANAYPSFSRIITYAESEIICTACKSTEERPRQAMHENRYLGERGCKPLYTRRTLTERHWEETRQIHQDLYGGGISWRGQGYPSYHGGGRRQFEHIRVSHYTLLSDYLYNRDHVHHGRINLPPKTPRKWERFWNSCLFAGALIDELVQECSKRVSIVSAYKRRGDPYKTFDQGFDIQIVPAHGVHINDLGHIAAMNPYVGDVRVGRVVNGIQRLRVVSVPLGGVQFDDQNYGD